MTARSFFSGLWRGLDVLRKVLQLLVLLVIFGVLVGALRGSVPHIPSRAALLVAPEGQLVEQLTGEPVERAVEQVRGEEHAETLLWDLTDSIHVAASDPRIQVLALDLEKFEGGSQPTLAELASALREFRASGKKVIAYGTELTQERYYLAAQADEIYLDPMGFVLVEGYDRYRTYLKDALDKLAVDINVFRVGAFQSAVETYMRTAMLRAWRSRPGWSPPSRPDWMPRRDWWGWSARTTRTAPSGRCPRKTTCATHAPRRSCTPRANRASV